MQQSMSETDRTLLQSDFERFPLRSPALEDHTSELEVICKYLELLVWNVCLPSKIGKRQLVPSTFNTTEHMKVYLIHARC